MMVFYLPVKLNSIGQNVFELEYGNGNFDGQTERTNKNMDPNYTNFKRNLAMMVNLSPCQVGIR